MLTSQPLTRSPNVLQADVNNRPVLMHSTKWEYLDFNAAGALIWTMLETPKTLDEVVAALQAQFRVDPAICRRDTEVFVEKLLREDFLFTAPETASA